jgi:hypothetical protein
MALIRIGRPLSRIEEDGRKLLEVQNSALRVVEPD